MVTDKVVTGTDFTFNTLVKAAGDAKQLEKAEGFFQESEAARAFVPLSGHRPARTLVPSRRAAACELRQEPPRRAGRASGRRRPSRARRSAFARDPALPQEGVPRSPGGESPGHGASAESQPAYLPPLPRLRK